MSTCPVKVFCRAVCNPYFFTLNSPQLPTEECANPFSVVACHSPSCVRRLLPQMPNPYGFDDRTTYTPINGSLIALFCDPTLPWADSSCGMRLKYLAISHLAYIETKLLASTMLPHIWISILDLADGACIRVASYLGAWVTIYFDLAASTVKLFLSQNDTRLSSTFCMAACFCATEAVSLANSKHGIIIHQNLTPCLRRRSSAT